MINKEIIKKIKLLVLDVDGVLTTGKLWYTANGEEIKSFHAHDGYGMKKLMRQGIDIAIISGRNSQAVVTRMTELGVKHVFQGHEDKLPILDKLLQQLQLSYEQVAYVGDDLPDVPCLKKVGLSISVKNARPEAIAAAMLVTQTKGGHGAVREICDLFLN